MVWYSYFFKNFSYFVVIHTVKGFIIVNEVEVDVFFWNPLAFSASSNISLYIGKFSVHVLLKSSLKDFEHNLASM